MRDSESHLFCKSGHPVTLSIRTKQQNPHTYNNLKLILMQNLDF